MTSQLGRFSGLSSAIQLKRKLGIDAEIFEATSDIGGTWNYNTYPGATFLIRSIKTDTCI